MIYIDTLGAITLLERLVVEEVGILPLLSLRIKYFSSTLYTPGYLHLLNHVTSRLSFMDYSQSLIVKVVPEDVRIKYRNECVEGTETRVGEIFNTSVG